MSDFDFHMNKALRLAILRLLAAAPGYKANSSVIHTSVNSMGFHVSRDRVQGQLDWLEEQSLTNGQKMGELVVAEITARGMDVAEGMAFVTGVDRPAPMGH